MFSKNFWMLQWKDQDSIYLKSATIIFIFDAPCQGLVFKDNWGGEGQPFLLRRVRKSLEERMTLELALKNE